jgi:hypothetical protein
LETENYLGVIEMTNQTIPVPREVLEQVLAGLEQYCEWATMVRPLEKRDALRNLLSAPSEPDKGPWTAGLNRLDTRVFVESDDFTHDVRLYVDGNFVSADEKYLYACAIARQLNSKVSAPSEPVAKSHARDAITWTPETGYVFAAKSPTLPNVDVAYKELSAIESIQGRSGSSIKLRGILTELNDALNAATAYAPSEPKPEPAPQAQQPANLTIGVGGNFYRAIGAVAAPAPQALTLTDEDWEKLFDVMHGETPYFYRRSLEKDCYEVGIRLNADWKEVISENQTVLLRFSSSADAQRAFDLLNFKRCWNAAHGIGEQS